MRLLPSQTSAGRVPGVRLRDGKATFLLRSSQAEGVELCLFDGPQARKESVRHALFRAVDDLWEATIPCREGQLYGYRVKGPWSPRDGLRFNPAKVLLDPWTLRVGRAPIWHDALHAETPESRRDGRDSAPWAALGAVVSLDRLPSTGSRPRVDPDLVVVYEAHVKGLTALHPSVPKALRGTYEGAAHPAVVEHVKRLGVTTLELLPIHHHADDRFLADKGLANYWGYSTLAYFAPHAGYARDPERALAEFRRMVRAYHDAGIEVVLDVVYNHTCEGPFTGPQLSWRGLGSHWYRRVPEHPLVPEDLTGCGNSLDFRQPEVVRFALESLSFWAEVGGVDGFRYDLASVHGRVGGRFDARAPFFRELDRLPSLRALHHIAEPWDATWDGYAVGSFPPGWLDWNDKFRDDLRRFWRGDDGAEVAFASRWAGSHERFGTRPPRESVNFAACHDGFTLHDLCAFSRKHNAANLEGNRDGSSHEICDNLGIEGETEDPLLLAARARRARNLVASTLLANGTPMLLAGDEVARTQRGNNNAYCQDNPISWIDWTSAPEGWPDAEWIAAVLALRRTLLAGSVWAHAPIGPDGVVAIHWKTARSSGMVLAQSAGPLRRVPVTGIFRRWLDTSSSEHPQPMQLLPGPVLLRPSSLLVLERLRP